jgi:hypothetical protein
MESIGAVTIKMMRSTSITSTSGVTLISAIDFLSLFLERVVLITFKPE